MKFWTLFLWMSSVCIRSLIPATILIWLLPACPLNYFKPAPPRLSTKPLKQAQLQQGFSR